MSVPVFNPNGWCLLYFPTEGKTYPLDPEELFDPGRFEYSKLRVKIVNEAGDEQTYPFQNRPTLLEAVESALNDPIVVSRYSKLFTIHSKGMLERMMNWISLRYRARSAPLISYSSAPIDIVESFNKPAVLTYEARRAFTIKDIQHWITHPGSPHQPGEQQELQALTSLCRLL